ncbi:MAG: hypothetical protein HYR56_22050 [Acidobacteria bacterium]|nr:hypothetical protein [Acidobacteriota bacterium]MBI3425656.1 hypothetical protein [Acidobacteriota bacterium]
MFEVLRQGAALQAHNKMLDQLIQNAAQLMHEQAAAYRRLNAACLQLCGALVGGQPEKIDSLTRAGAGELLKMRVRLVELMAALSAFADRHVGNEGQPALSNETRVAFRAASNELLSAARAFQRTQARAAAVANNGATFTASCIELSGVPPLTYRAPYARRGEVKSWA